MSISLSQAPSSMKSVLQACWLLTVAFGDLLVVGVDVVEVVTNEFSIAFDAVLQIANVLVEDDQGFSDCFKCHHQLSLGFESLFVV